MLDYMICPKVLLFLSRSGLRTFVVDVAMSARVFIDDFLSHQCLNPVHFLHVYFSLSRKWYSMCASCELTRPSSIGLIEVANVRKPHRTRPICCRGFDSGLLRYTHTRTYARTRLARFLSFHSGAGRLVIDLLLMVSWT